MHLALKPVFTMGLPIDCLNTSRMCRQCFIILYGMASFDDMKIFIILQFVAITSEIHAYFSMIPYIPDALNDCPINILLAILMTVAPILSATFLKV